MTKRHFIALAAALRQTRDAIATSPADGAATEHALRGWRQTVRDVANVCAQANARFDRARFLAACGMED